MAGIRTTVRTSTLLVVIVCLSVVPAVPGAHAATAVITSSGPLNEIHLGAELNCDVRHAEDAAPEFYGSTACATLVRVGDTLYRPSDIPAGSAASPYTAFTPVSQSSVLGDGTAADPYRVVTVVDLPGTAVRVTQTDRYVVGHESYRTDVQVQNTGDGQLEIIVYRAGDCYLQDADQGFGAVDPDSGAVACVGVDDSGTAPGDRIEQWFPLTSGSSYLEAGYSEVWAKIGAGEPFGDTCRCDELIDNGAGLSWEVTLGAGQAFAASHLTTFSPLGVEPLQLTKTAASPTAPPGGTNGYTITISNPNVLVGGLQVETIVDHLPTGFGYIEGSTTGVTSADPAVSGQDLTWTGPFEVPAEGAITLNFEVRVPRIAGRYTNDAEATADTVAVIPAVDAAPVEVGAEQAERMDGKTRIETAVAVSRAQYGGDGSAAAAVLARSDKFPDGLAGSPLAAAVDAPLLLTFPEVLADATRTELRRVLPEGRTVYVLGGTTAISDAVADEIASLGYEVVRLAGSTRFETAIEIAGALDDPPVLLVTAGHKWPDALVAGASAVELGGAILLGGLSPDHKHPSTAAYLAGRNDRPTVYAIGGAAVNPYAEEPEVDSTLAGPGREETALLVAQTLFREPSGVGVTRRGGSGGDDDTLFADALTGSVHVGRIGGPMLLSAGDALDARIAEYVCEWHESIFAAYVYGGAAAVSDAVLAKLSDHVVGRDCSTA